jgi:hypothetical protein
MRCETCKHWELPDEDADYRAARRGFGRCRALRMLDTIEEDATRGMGWPGGPTVNWDADTAAVAWTKAEDDAVKAEMAYTQDGSGYRADVYTTSDFFCARHEGTAD